MSILAATETKRLIEELAHARASSQVGSRCTFSAWRAVAGSSANRCLDQQTETRTDRMTELTLEAICRFCQSRPVELTLAPCERPGSIVLRADFEGSGDFFSIRSSDVEYVQLAGRFWVGGLLLSDWYQLSGKAPEWETLRGEYSGSALGMWASDAKSFEGASRNERFVIVASRFVFIAGCGWKIL